VDSDVFYTIVQISNPDLAELEAKITFSYKVPFGYQQDIIFNKQSRDLFK